MVYTVPKLENWENNNATVIVKLTKPTWEGLKRIKNKTALFKYPSTKPMVESIVVLTASF